MNLSRLIQKGCYYFQPLNNKEIIPPFIYTSFSCLFTTYIYFKYYFGKYSRILISPFILLSNKIIHNNDIKTKTNNIIIIDHQATYKNHVLTHVLDKLDTLDITNDNLILTTKNGITIVNQNTTNTTSTPLILKHKIIAVEFSTTTMEAAIQIEFDNDKYNISGNKLFTPAFVLYLLEEQYLPRDYIFNHSYKLQLLSADLSCIELNYWSHLVVE